MASLAQTIYDALLKAGATPIQAAAIIGNMEQESSLNPEVQAMDSNGAYSRGLVQWNDKGAGSGVNWSQYITGNVTNDIINQVLLLKSQGGFAAAAGNTVQEAAANFMQNFERPASNSSEGARVANAAEVATAAATNNWSGLQFGTGEATSIPATSGGPATSTQSAGGIDPNTGQPLTMADTSGIQAYIQQNYPEDAWMLSIPDVAQVLDQAAVKGLADADVTALIEATTWWKTTTAAVRQFDQTMATDPSAYDFNKAGSEAQQMFSQVANAASQAGVTYNTAGLQNIAMEALKYGWSTQQIQARLGYSVTVSGANGASTNAGGVVQQLQAQAGQYLMNPTDPVLQSWAQNIVGGTQTIQQFDAYLKQWASTKWSGMAGQIRQGYTPQQIVSPLASSISQALEISPDQVDFINNPNYAKILDYVPPGSTNGVHQIMTNSQALQYVKSDPAFGYGNTQGAKDNAAQLEQTIVQNFGKVGS